MRAARRGRAERGSISPIICFVCVALAALGVGGATLGRVAAIRMDGQRAADAACLAATQLIREQGLPFDGPKQAIASTIGAKNARVPVGFSYGVHEQPTYVEITCNATINLTVPKLIYPSGQVTVSARAKAKLPQTRFDEATRRLPKFVLVLDYSGSMLAIMPGSGGKSGITVLEESVAGLLDANLDIDYGAAFFSSSVFTTVGIGPGAPAQIKARMATYGAGGATNTAGGLTAARNLLAAAEDTGRYVLLVSDGQPNAGGGPSGARAAADSVWAVGGTIFTLHIDWSGGSGTSLASFMKSVSGTPGSHPNAGYYYRATDSATLQSTFETIVSSIVCSVGPLAPAPSDPGALRVFLRTGTAERLLPAVPDLGAASGIEAYRYDAPTATVRLTQTACDRVLDVGDKVVVRSGSPGLSE